MSTNDDLPPLPREFSYAGHDHGISVYSADQMQSYAREAVAADMAKHAVPERVESAIATAYGFLWCVNNEPGTPMQYPPERAAYEARKALRELLTKEQRGQAINAVVTKVRGCGCQLGTCESKLTGCRMAEEVKPGSGAQ